MAADLDGGPALPCPGQSCPSTHDAGANVAGPAVLFALQSHPETMMTVWTSVFRTSKRYKGVDILRASVVTALVPTAMAALLLWLVPEGCDLRGNIAVYRWTCLLPGLLTAVPTAVAMLLPIAMVLNRRLTRPLPDGWLVITLAVGLLTQVLLSGFYLIALGAAYRTRFLAEVIFIPQPFVAGAVAGAVFWFTLNLGRGCRGRGCRGRGRKAP